MLESLADSKFVYKKLSEEEQKARGILGRLVGPCADFVHKTRNDRKYSEELWENVFNNPIMKEKIANKCCFGELNHPSDRTEVDIKNVAICLAEQPKKGKDGKLYSVFDILNTPNGRILKALCDYGCKIGISSRGQGDIDGDEVDPDTYDCECFDAVLVPGVEAARLTYVTESLNNKNKNLKTALQESFNRASDEEKEIMKNTLDNLNIDIDTEVNESISEREELIDFIESKCVSREGWQLLDDAIRKVTDKDPDKLSDEDPVEGMYKEFSTEELVKIKNYIKDVISESLSEDTDKELDDESSDADDAEEVDIDKDTSENDSDSEEGESEYDDSSDSDVEQNSDEPNFDDNNENIEEEQELFIKLLHKFFPEDAIKKIIDILDIEDLDAEYNDSHDASEINSEIESEVQSQDSDEDINNTNTENTDIADDETDKAVDDGMSALVDSLKVAIKNNSELENTIKDLQEKLAVSDAKVNDITEECNQYKISIARLSKLSKSAKELKENISKLEESLSEKDKIISTQKTRISNLVSSRKENAKASSELTEALESKSNEINLLNEKFNKNDSEYKSKINELNEQMQKLTDSHEKELTSLKENVNKQTVLKESYKKLANKAVNKYIDIKAQMIGLTSSDVKRKLGESYTLDDVDQVCEDLKSYQLNVSKLPFSIDKRVSIKVNESMKNNLKTKAKLIDDDDVDDGLIQLANFNN